MKTSALVAVVVIVGFLAAKEAAFIQGHAMFAQLVLVAGLITALFFSFAKGIPKTEAVMASGEGGDTIKVKGFGGEVDMQGPNLLARTVGSNIATNVLLLLIAAGLYFHDNATTEAQRRLAAAVEISNYIGLQSEEKRLEIGKRMAEPEALRKLYR